MSEIKEVICNEKDFGKLTESILRHKELEFIPKGFTKEEFEKLKKETREFLSEKFQTDFTTKPIIANGHQPEFQHPGILFKDLLIHKIAGLTNGLPLHVVVDTDHFEMSYFYPERLETGFAHLKTLHLKDADNRVYSQTTLSDADRKELLSIIQSQQEEAKYFISPKIQKEFTAILNRKLELVKSCEYLFEINETIREEFYQSKGIHLYRVNVSELVKLNSFKVLVEKIREHLDNFMQVYNQSLTDYRKEHKIKNHAQPIPNLVSGEMPFWILDPVTKKRNVMRVEDSLDNVCILPKAVTLTMFLRLFMTDFFIHGKGGGRYEEVSEHIIKEFFKIEAAPYEVASATMNLNKTEWFPVPDVDEKELELKLRDAVYSPEKFLDHSHLLAIQKKELQSKFKNPDSDKKALHKEISDLNEEMGKLIDPEKQKLEALKSQLPVIQHTSQVFQSRTLPFYYYDMDELIAYVAGM
jgi:hypothetical protein